MTDTDPPFPPARSLQSAEAMPLSDDYYLKNFRSLVNFVRDQYTDILSSPELAWGESVLRCSEPAQRLYVRLLGRRGDWFRIGKLRYPEIPDLVEAAAELEARNLACLQAPSDTEQLLSHFTRAELIKQVSGSPGKSMDRSTLLAHVLEHHQDALSELAAVEQFVHVHGREAFKVHSLCFFGNLYQDLTEFVLRDLGTIQYEAYDISPESRMFQSREQLSAHWQYFVCRDRFDAVDKLDVAALAQLDSELPNPVPSLSSNSGQHDRHLQRRIDRLRYQIARQLERIDSHELALELYRNTTRPPSRERQVRILATLDRDQEAHSLCHAMIEAPISEDERYFAEMFLPRLARKAGAAPLPKKRFRPASTRLTLTPGESRVEFVARDFYAQFGDCFYVENSLVNGVLGLFLWDLVFMPVQGAFFNPFQSAPADFREPEFRRVREPKFSERWSELDDGLRFSARVWTHFESKRGLMNPLVNWRVLSEPILTKALMRIPVQDWRVLFERLLADMTNNTSGWPDLILFPADGGYEFLEIKGPGDALQKHQRRWMAWFSEHRIPYRVVYVSWAQ